MTGSPKRLELEIEKGLMLSYAAGKQLVCRRRPGLTPTLASQASRLILFESILSSTVHGASDLRPNSTHGLPLLSNCALHHL